MAWNEFVRMAFTRAGYTSTQIRYLSKVYHVTVKFKPLKSLKSMVYAVGDSASSLLLLRSVTRVYTINRLRPLERVFISLCIHKFACFNMDFSFTLIGYINIRIITIHIIIYMNNNVVKWKIFMFYFNSSLCLKIFFSFENCKIQRKLSKFKIIFRHHLVQKVQNYFNNTQFFLSTYIQSNIIVKLVRIVF